MTGTAPAAPSGPSPAGAADLAAAVRELARRADALAAAVDGELAALGTRAGDAPDALADRILPLSRKAAGAGLRARRLAGLARQGHRLAREGVALREESRALRPSGPGARPAVGRWLADLQAWAAEVAAHRRRLADWSSRVVEHLHRRRREREGL
jgi:hypothetical protein